LISSLFSDWLWSNRNRYSSSQEALDLLGLRERELSLLANSNVRAVITLPHASPNLFMSRLHTVCRASELVRSGNADLHIRVVLTHTNMSDLRWRPYAWWYLDLAGNVRRKTIFTRNKRRKHVSVMSLPPLDVSLNDAREPVAGAALIARNAPNLAFSYMIAMAYIERAANLHHGVPTLYLPLDLLVEFVLSNEYKLGCIGQALQENVEYRTLNALGEVVIGNAQQAVILDHISNMRLLGTLSPATVLGGMKTERYWPHVIESSTKLGTCQGWFGIPPMEIVEPFNELSVPYQPSGKVVSQLKDLKIEYSLALALADTN